MVQNVENPESNKKCQKVHISFQSTSSWNIQTVNMLSCVTKFVDTREQGIGKNKRKWVITMNDARQLYLNTYYVIDRINHYIKNCHMRYCCCKYWHSPKICGKALAVVIAYDIYLDVAKGDVVSVCKLKKCMTFWEIRERLSEQMWGYRPLNKLYMGDENMQVCVQQHKVRREKRGRPKTDDDRNEITSEKIKQARHT
eukprot:9026364-Ditylum_brightwellii.AAC.1